jgi:peptide/nickel transport system permease protein
MPEHTPEHPPAFSEDWRSETTTAQQEPHPFHGSRLSFLTSRVNWPLWVGGLMVLTVLTIALVGPSLAPQDPMQELTIIKVGDSWEMPPFSPRTVPGFPMGSDQFGRDLLSRLLWGVRPTMIMVIAVAAVRLVLGFAIGLSAGWFTGRVRQALDTTIGLALSVPVLMVALAAIAALGVELGLLAFIIGLSINGWVETARLVREQTQLIKGNLYIEAARALGAPDAHILLRHVLRQLMPMAWMLFSFEISGTLLTTAGLGFLGYYIGGDVWLDVDDFVARRLSGMPELGQMLASAWSEQQVITEPWGMIIAGSAIFCAVLGFNLLGEGLRLRLSLERVHRRTLLSTVAGRVKAWAKEKGFAPDAQQAQPGIPGKARLLRPTLTGAMVLILAGGLYWWRLQASESSSSGQAAPGTTRPDEHLWAAERHDPHGTLWSPASGPIHPGVLWIFEDRDGFAGGPTVSANGNLYLASSGGTLYSLDPSGNILWQASLPAASVGTPALSQDGTIYVTDEQGNLSAFAPDGTPAWRREPEAPGKATTGPVVGPDGTIFYPSSGKMQAVSPNGELLWTVRVPYGFDPLPPQLSPSGELVFFLDNAYSATDGSPFDLAGLAGKAANEQYFMGADGSTYYRSGAQIVKWGINASGVQVIQNLNKQVPGHPRDTGVTPNGTVWATFSLGYNSPDLGIVWLDFNDQILGNIEFQQSPSQVIGVDQNAVVFTCGNTLDNHADCVAAEPGAEDLLWRITLEENAEVVGGALVPERLYVTLEHGKLYAIGPQVAAEGEAQTVVIRANPSEEQPTSTPATVAESVSTPETPAPTALPTPTPVATFPTPVSPGDMLTFTVSVVNKGPSGARGVLFTDTLPIGMALTSATSSQGTGCAAADSILTCDLGDLANGAGATITLVVTIDVLTTETITHSARVTSQVLDPDPADNRFDQQTTITIEANPGSND